MVVVHLDYPGVGEQCLDCKSGADRHKLSVRLKLDFFRRQVGLQCSPRLVSGLVPVEHYDARSLIMDELVDGFEEAFELRYAAELLNQTSVNQRKVSRFWVHEL